MDPQQNNSYNLDDHIKSISRISKNKNLEYYLALIPSIVQIGVIQSINEKKGLKEEQLKSMYYCQEQKIKPFLGCFKYQEIPLNQVHEIILQITEKLIKACTVVFFVSVIPFVYSIIGLSFVQFFLILLSRFFIQNWLSSAMTLNKTKMGILMTFWVIFSLVLIGMVSYYLFEEFIKQDGFSYYRLIIFALIQILLLFYEIYWCNYYLNYLLDITQYTKVEQAQLYKNKLLIDFYLLQKYFNCHFNSNQKFYLLKKNQLCRISEESIKFSIDNKHECDKFYIEYIKNQGNKDIESQLSHKLTKSENVRNHIIANAVLEEIKDQLASSETLNQQELASIIETNRIKKVQENPTMLPSLLSQRSSMFSSQSPTPSYVSPSNNTKRNFLQVDNIYITYIHSEFQINDQESQQRSPTRENKKSIIDDYIKEEDKQLFKELKQQTQEDKQQIKQDQEIQTKEDKQQIKEEKLEKEERN